MSTNPLPHYVSGIGSVKALEVDDLMSLKIPMDKVYEMMEKARYKIVMKD